METDISFVTKRKHFLAQCDQIFTAVITKRCAEILPNGICFYQTRANSAFLNFWLHTVNVVTCYPLFGLFHGDRITKPNNYENIISKTFPDRKLAIQMIL